MAEKKKIALCLEYPLLLRGGVSVLVETLLEGLSAHFDIVLVSSDPSGSLDGQAAGRHFVRHLNWNPAAISASTSRRLAGELAKAGVELAHFHFGGVFGWGNRFPNQCPVLFLPRLGVRCCSTVHLVVHPLDGFCGPNKPLLFKLALFPIAWSAKLQELRQVACEIAVSNHDYAKLRRWYWPMRRKFRQMYHSRLRKADRPEQDGPRHHEILNVGHIAARKGQLELVEAFAQIASRYPEWKLSLAGDVLEEHSLDRIREIATRDGLTDRIQLLGPRMDAFQLMRRAGIYIQPSRFEALGLALQEAMFAGCPAVGTRVGGIPELIEHERTGLLTEPRNPGALARAMEQLISNPALREKFGRAGADSILQKGMTEEQMIASHVELYESILRRVN